MQWLFHRVLPVGYGAAFLLATVALAVFMQHYLDFTDQSFYLLTLSNPQDVLINVNPFHLYVAPLLQALGYEQYLLRVACLFLLLLFSLPLGQVCIKALFGQQTPWAYWPVYLLAVLSFYRTFVIDPGYKWFLMLATMTYLAGMVHLLLQAEDGRSLRTGGLLAGLGGWMAFMSKPPTAALFALMLVAACAYLIWRKRYALRDAISCLFLAGLAVVLLAAFHFTLLDSPAEYWQRLQHGMEFAALMEGGYSIGDQLSEIADDLKLLFFAIIMPGALMWVFIVLASLISVFKGFRARHPHLFFALLLGDLLIGIAAVMKLPLLQVPQAGLKELLLALALHAVFAFRYAYYSRLFAIEDRKAFVLLILCILASFAYRFGSGVNYAMLMNYQGVIMLLILLFLGRSLLSAPHFTKACHYVVFPVIALFFVKVWQSYNFPYSSSVPVYQQQQKTQLTSHPGNELYLDEISHRYITQAHQTLKQQGFVPGQLIIDLTGYTPAISYIAQAKPTPFPWVAGTVSGAKQAMLYNLSLLPQSELEEAWILSPAHTAPKPADMPGEWLEAVGLNFPADYQKLVELERPWPEGHRHALWKPKKGRGD